MDYMYVPSLAPTQAILDAYKKQGVDWETYETAFLLCSEDTPTRCHRRLVVEYLQQKWGDVEITHLR